MSRLLDERMDRMARVVVDRIWREKRAESIESGEKVGKYGWRVDGEMVREESMEELKEMGEWEEWELEELEEWVDREVRGWEDGE